MSLPGFRRKILVHVFLFFYPVRRRYTGCLRADGIEPFVTFDFDPSFISRLITDSDLDQIK